MSRDVIVLGLGAMGSAAALHLAERGKRVLGIEQFSAAHDQGSSHGGSRMIRQAYFESPHYIPLVLRAYELWRKLERDSGKRLLHITGGLNIGSRDGELVRRTIAAAEQHAIPFEVVEGSAISRRFPVVAPLTGDAAVHETNAGYLLPEECIRAHLALASHAGAELLFEETVLSWNAEGDGVEVRTSKGTYSAEHLLITAGPWANQALHEIFPLRVTRQVMAWIQPTTGVRPFLPESFPVFLCEDLDGGFPGYGFPAIDGPAGGIKAAIHGSDWQCSPESVDREVHQADVRRIVEQLRVRMPALDGEVVRAKTCMYTMSPDEHFVIGLHPRFSSCTVACGFSGHGFKFASVVGEILADLATKGSTSHPISLFSPQRFSCDQ
ncbi:N-methyl-L-tryptophan oxidase [Telmatobacter sp. DSM 110680]|uniref:N-methyl-L-tryptophan oxidase n=1 Tax=Telmatobacter sp. DSM 110680 TaxID=3036704 RepID=A0AAU7DEU6_9BACT